MTTSNETPETETTESAPKKADPIDAEFEPAQGPDPTEDKSAKSGVGMATVAAWSIGAALAGGTIGVIGAGASNVDTSKFAPAEIRTEVETLANTQSKVSDKLDKAWESISITEARLDGQVDELNDKLAARVESQALLRDEFDALIAQLDALVGSETHATETHATETHATETSDSDAATSGDDEAAGETDAAAPSAPPLQRLMNRIDYLETRLAEADNSPETTGQLKRALTDVSARLDAVETANSELQRALNKREEAMTSLQSGLFTANQAIAEVEDRVVTMAEAETTEADSPNEDLSVELDALRAEIASLKGMTTQPSETSAQPEDDMETPAVVETSAAPEEAVESESSPVEISDIDQMALAISVASLAMAKLDGDSSNGKPFPSSWDKLKAAMPNNANVDAIKAISRRGAPTLSDIRSSFKPIQKSLEKQIQEQGKNDGLDWARQALGGVVSVRRTDAEGDTPAAVLNRIVQSLDDADLTSAIENADLLEGFSDSDFDTWLSGARARQTLDGNVNAIREEILEKSAELAERK